MSRRILVAVLGVATFAVAAFGLPLALAVSRLYRDQEVINLERRATLAGLQVPASFATSGDPPELAPGDRHRPLGLYDTSGRLVVGQGPSRADPAVTRALAGRVNDGFEQGAIVVAVPLSADEQVFAVVRAAVPESVVAGRTRRTWASMAALAVAALLVAALLARRQARRLARPVARLADTARRLGQGEFSATTLPSGVAEIDQVGETLSSTAHRLGNVLARERAFSADASHQLRTSLTGLRLGLENALTTPGTDPVQAIRESVKQLDRVDATVEALLRLARDAPAASTLLDVDALLEEARDMWHGRFAAAGRPLRLSIQRDLPDARISTPAAHQILDVLLDNAFRHASGVVTIRARAGGTGLVIEVTDEGPGVDGPTDEIFRRRSSGAGTGYGIGLALARSLAEAEGGRLQCTAGEGGAVFALCLAAVDEDSRGDAVIDGVP